MKTITFLTIKTVFLFSIFFSLFTANAQAPQKMSYQAEIRNTSNILVVNTVVGIKFSILQTTSQGNAVYTETQTPTTSVNGLISVEIGAGIPVSGNFSTINWAAGPYFIKIETDPTGGTNYTISGTSQLLSVPYALYAANAWGINGNAGTNPTVNFIGTSDNKDVIFKRSNTIAGRIGAENTSLGLNSLINSYANEAFNTAIGNSALKNNSDGKYNVAIGFASLTNNHLGSYNTANGNASLTLNTDGNFNTANGCYALYFNNLGNKNVATGYQAAYHNTTGINNSVAGYAALLNNSIGNDNTAVGYNSLLNSKADRNTAVGSNSLSALSNGSYNTAFGGYAYVTGNFSNSSALGDFAIITASNQVRLGDVSITSIGGFQNWTNVSDKRFKKDIQSNVPGLDFIKKLNPVTYHLDMDAIARLMKTPEELRKKDSEALKGALLQTGFIAQEVEQAAKETGFDFSGVDAPKNDTDFYGLRYAEFVVPLVKAVQEQQIIIEKLLKRIEKIEQK
jgi:trimeric autotransporter adhesin